MAPKETRCSGQGKSLSIIALRHHAPVPGHSAANAA